MTTQQSWGEQDTAIKPKEWYVQIEAIKRLLAIPTLHGDVHRLIKRHEKHLIPLGVKVRKGYPSFARLKIISQQREILYHHPTAILNLGFCENNMMLSCNKHLFQTNKERQATLSSNHHHLNKIIFPTTEYHHDQGGTLCDGVPVLAVATKNVL